MWEWIANLFATQPTTGPQPGTTAAPAPAITLNHNVHPLTINLNINLTVRHVAARPPKPGPITFTLLSEAESESEDHMDVLHYDVSLPPAGADVDAREFTTKVVGQPDAVLPLDAAVTNVQISVPQDSQVTLSLVDIDDAGNRSEPATVSFRAIDTLPPAKPGEIAVTLVSEEEVAELPVVPAPADPAPVEPAAETTPEPEPAPEAPVDPAPPAEPVTPDPETPANDQPE